VKPRLLIASPQMRDPFFQRTVVLLWHHDTDGAIGVVINRLMEHELLDVIDVDREQHPMDLSPYQDTLVGWGGPVESASGTVVTRGEIRDDEGWVLEGDLKVTRSQDALVRLLGEGAEIHLVLGYAGWGPGQLDEEISSGGWLWTDCDASILFEHAPERRYHVALASLGLNETNVWMQPIDE
jgi:putative transcriptional regulator